MGIECAYSHDQAQITCGNNDAQSEKQITAFYFFIHPNNPYLKPMKIPLTKNV